jgi:integrase
MAITGKAGRAVDDSGGEKVAAKITTDNHIRNAKPGAEPYKRLVGKGLYLEIRPNGAKLWRYRYRIGGKENMFALGEYPSGPIPRAETPRQAAIRRAAGTYTLAEAVTAREEARALVKQGLHPAHQRQAQKAAQIAMNANTFEAVAAEWIGKNQVKWSGYYLHQVQSFLRADVFPKIGATPIRNVTAAQLLKILEAVHKRAPTVALLLRQWCSAIFRYGVATLRADGDPVSALRGAFHRPRTVHKTPLTRADIPTFFAALDAYGGYEQTKCALRLAMLTFVRPGELRKGEWMEFDLDRAEWRIPAERMKMRESHIVPLSVQAVTVLRELQRLTGGQRFLFPNQRRPNEHMSMTTLNRALERMKFNGTEGRDFSAHGFRATASTMLNELGFRPDVIERQLAHKERNQVRSSYNRAEYLPERRQMMQAWADQVDAMARGLENVVPLRRAALNAQAG